MNELEAKCYLTKQGGANNSDHDCIYSTFSSLYIAYVKIDNPKFTLTCIIFSNAENKSLALGFILPFAIFFTYITWHLRVMCHCKNISQIKENTQASQTKRPIEIVGILQN